MSSHVIFRNPQSFTLLSSQQLLDKLRWELLDLRQAQWDESIDSWRQVVSYKAINFATTAWHLIEWVDEDTRRASIPRAALAHCLGIQLPSDPPTRSDESGSRKELSRIRTAMIGRCSELEICRVIAVASKHYEVRIDPIPTLRTEACLSTKTRDGELFQRPFMFLRVVVDGIARPVVEVFENVLQFWEETCPGVAPGGHDYEVMKSAQRL